MPRVLLLVTAGASILAPVATGTAAGPPPPHIEWFFQAASQDERRATQALAQIAATWNDKYASLIVDLARLMRPARRERVETSEDPGFEFNDEIDSPQALGLDHRTPEGPTRHPSSRIRERLVRFLEKRTGQRFGDDLTRWRQWSWNRPYDPHPDYPAFKARLYANIDPRMREFFSSGVRSLIRLDEIEWGGVPVNGIPPLVYPKHIRANEARYLKDDHLVFGIALNGEARAYPKRILAWHELARDRLAGVELTIVYCTLCGTVIPYESEVGGRLRTFGTSGLLYRSNKLMFDEESGNLWSALEGRPVVGSLAGTPTQLSAHSIVTTTWQDWKTEHPNTTVLSLETGHKRDYSEGAAYRDYLATDRLMFPVPATDDRLKNKAEVLVMRLPLSGNSPGERQPLAVSVEFLSRHPLYHATVKDHAVVILTSRDGANRVYETADVRFERRLANDRLRDTSGRTWRITEDALTLGPDSAVRLPRVPAQRAFWFGWYAQFPNTLLIK